MSGELWWEGIQKGAATIFADLRMNLSGTGSNCLESYVLCPRRLEVNKRGKIQPLKTVDLSEYQKINIVKFTCTNPRNVSAKKDVVETFTFYKKKHFQKSLWHFVQKSLWHFHPPSRLSAPFFVWRFCSCSRLLVQIPRLFCVRVGLNRISSQIPVSDLGEWRYICHFFHWQKMSRVTFVTFLGRMWRFRTRIFFVNLWRFLSHPSRKTSHFGPAGTKLFWTGKNVTIRLGLKHIFLFPSQICHLSRKREAGRPFGLRLTLRGVLKIFNQRKLSNLSALRVLSPVNM